MATQDFSAFDAIGDDFAKTEARPQYASEATEKLGDGEYDAEVTAGVMKVTNYGPIVEIKMTVLTDGKFKGWKIEKVYFLTKEGEGGGRVKDEIRLRELKTDLNRCGFAVDTWPGAKFSSNLTIACEMLKGLHLKIKKKQNGEYANLYFNKRAADADGKPVDGKPAKFAADQMVAPSAAFAGGSSGFDTTPAPKQEQPTAPPTTPW